jgi:hypothetical protein
MDETIAAFYEIKTPQFFATILSPCTEARLTGARKDSARDLWTRLNLQDPL